MHPQAAVRGVCGDLLEMPVPLNFIGVMFEFLVESQTASGTRMKQNIYLYWKKHLWLKKLLGNKQIYKYIFRILVAYANKPKLIKPHESLSFQNWGKCLLCLFFLFFFLEVICMNCCDQGPWLAHRKTASEAWTLIQEQVFRGLSSVIYNQNGKNVRYFRGRTQNDLKKQTRLNI